MNVKAQLLHPNNPCNGSKVDWHSILNFGIIITDYEGNIIDLDVSFVKFGLMKNFPIMKTNALIAECRLWERMN
jgi:hypothetical protein